MDSDQVAKLYLHRAKGPSRPTSGEEKSTFESFAVGQELYHMQNYPRTKQRLTPVPTDVSSLSETSSTLDGEKGALQDYQMQLILLEQQNKRRLSIARQEQDTMQKIVAASFSAPTFFSAPTVSPSPSAGSSTSIDSGYYSQSGAEEPRSIDSGYYSQFGAEEPRSIEPPLSNILLLL